MRSLRSHVRELQIIENEAAEKAGMRFVFFDEVELMKDPKKYIEKYISQLEIDIFPEAVKAAKMGKKLNSEINEKEE